MGFGITSCYPFPSFASSDTRAFLFAPIAGSKKPSDLRGKTVATVGYSSSGLTHVRGILQEEYGVSPNDIRWISVGKDSATNLTGGVSNWEKIRPDGVQIVDADPEEDESSLLIKGKVDAILHPALPKVFQDGNPIVARLFTDHRSVEKEFYKRTGVFPIMPFRGDQTRNCRAESLASPSGV